MSDSTGRFENQRAPSETVRFRRRVRFIQAEGRRASLPRETWMSRRPRRRHLAKDVLDCAMRSFSSSSAQGRRLDATVGPQLLRQPLLRLRRLLRVRRFPAIAAFRFRAASACS